jgi:hypothetical protein
MNENNEIISTPLYQWSREPSWIDPRYLGVPWATTDDAKPRRVPVGQQRGDSNHCYKC